MKHSKNLLAVLFTCAFLSFSTTNVLADDVDLSAVCPISVVAGSPLVIDVTVSNKSFTEVTVNRFMTALGRGSKKNTLGMIGVYGPFAYNLPESVTVPGFTSTSIEVLVIDSVPNSLQGQMAGASASLVNSEGGIDDSTGCVVEVIGSYGDGDDDDDDD